MVKHVLLFLVLLSVVFASSPASVSASDEPTNRQICRFDKNSDGVVDIMDFAIVREEIEDWKDSKKAKYMEDFIASFGQLCKNY